MCADRIVEYLEPPQFIKKVQEIDEKLEKMYSRIVHTRKQHDFFRRYVYAASAGLRYAAFWYPCCPRWHAVPCCVLTCPCALAVLPTMMRPATHLPMAFASTSAQTVDLFRDRPALALHDRARQEAGAAAACGWAR